MKLFGGGTVKMVVKQLEHHPMVEVEVFQLADPMQCHTFSPRCVKPLSVILHDIDAHIDQEEILLKLRELGFPVLAFPACLPTPTLDYRST